MALEQYRKEIDAIDEQLTALFEQRMTLAGQVAEEKRVQGLPIFQAGREEEVQQRAADRIHNPEFVPGIRRLMQNMMDISKQYQRTCIGLPNPVPALKSGVRAGYQGVPGAYSEEALSLMIAQPQQVRNYRTFEELFRAIDREEVDYGVLPMENSTAGGVFEVYDLMLQYHFYIAGEAYLEIAHVLAGLEGADLESVREVFSHPQAIDQCGRFFHQHSNMKLIPCLNTAAAAQAVSESGDPTKAAIASLRAARLYGLTPLAMPIQDQVGNTTRFVLVSKRYEKEANATKNSVVFSLDNRAGTLYHLLQYFFDYHINMVKIESRPQRNSPWEYFLYVDFEGDMNDPSIRAAMDGLARDAGYFQLLGSYPLQGRGGAAG